MPRIMIFQFARRSGSLKFAALLMVLVVAACSAPVKPNPSYPGFVGTYGPGSAGWLGTAH